MNPLYLAAKEHLGEILTLNPSIPPEEGCVQAVSTVLKDAGFPIPSGGISGVNALITWVLANGFIENSYPTIGGIITAHSPDVNNPNYAHAGVVLKYGIASNNSFGGKIGRFTENYTIDSFIHFFSEINGSNIRYFDSPQPTL